MIGKLRIGLLDTDMKICCKCKKEKPLTEFNKDKHQSGGYKYACKECTKKDFKAFYSTNIDKMQERAREYRIANLEKRKEYEKEYIKKNRGKKNLWTRTREANKNKRTPQWADMEKIKAYYDVCAFFNEINGYTKYHVDHKIPLQGKNISGLHVHNNLQVILAEDNVKKGNRYYG